MSGEIFILDENHQIHRAKNYELVRNRFIVYDSEKDEYLPFDNQEDFKKHLQEHKEQLTYTSDLNSDEINNYLEERYYTRDEKFYRYIQDGLEVIRPSEDIVFFSEIVDPRKVTAQNIELYLKVKKHVQTYNFNYLYLASYYKQELNSGEKHQTFFDNHSSGQPYTLLSPKVIQAQMGLIAQDRQSCVGCPGRIYRYQPKRSLKLVRLDDILRPDDLLEIFNLFPNFSRDADVANLNFSLNSQMKLFSTVCQQLDNYRIDGYYDTLHLGGFPLCIPRKLLTYTGVSYLLISPEKPMTLNHKGQLNQSRHNNPQWDPIYVAVVSDNLLKKLEQIPKHHQIIDLKDISKFRYVPYQYRNQLNQLKIKSPNQSRTIETSVISSSVKIDDKLFSRDYLFSPEYVPERQNYTDEEFRRFLLIDKDKLMRNFNSRRE